MLVRNLPSWNASGHFPHQNSSPQPWGSFGPERPQSFGMQYGQVERDARFDRPNPNCMPLPCFAKEKMKDTASGRKKNKKASRPGQAAPPPQPTPLAEQKRHEVDVDCFPFVEVRGLPKHLMTTEMMNATLDAAGLLKDDDVMGVFFLASCPDVALLQALSVPAAEKCVKHFHGCKWNQV